MSLPITMSCKKEIAAVPILDTVKLKWKRLSILPKATYLASVRDSIQPRLLTQIRLFLYSIQVHQYYLPLKKKKDSDYIEKNPTCLHHPYNTYYFLFCIL